MPENGSASRVTCGGASASAPGRAGPAPGRAWPAAESAHGRLSARARARRRTTLLERGLEEALHLGDAALDRRRRAPAAGGDVVDGLAVDGAQRPRQAALGR